MKIFKLYSNCIPVKGIVRSTICDLQKGKFHLIPNDLLNILETYENKPLGNIYDDYGLENKEALDQYFKFLIDSELGFFMDENDSSEEFPALDMTWHFPGKISNAIIEVGNILQQKNWLPSIFDQLEDLGTRCLEIRFLKDFNMSEIEEILSYTKAKIFTDLKLVFNNPKGINAKKILQKNIRTSSIIFFNNEKSIVDNIYNVPIIYLDTTIDIHKACGNINENLFLTNNFMHTESLKFNNCLNRKVTIDENGNIKNCPAFSKSFGNITDISLKNVIELEEFKKLWSISKSEIDTCRSCEFRYVCMDCRAYVEDPSDINSKPLKCGYDPTQGIWEEWSTNPIKQKSKEYYQLN